MDQHPPPGLGLVSGIKVSSVLLDKSEDSDLIAAVTRSRCERMSWSTESSTASLRPELISMGRLEVTLITRLGLSLDRALGVRAVAALRYR